MVSIVIVENGASQSKLVKAIESAKAANANVTVVANVSQLEAMNGVRVIPAPAHGMAGALERAVRESTSNQVIIADARLASYNSIKSIISESSNSGAVFTYAPVEVAGESLDLPDMGKDRLVAMIALNPQLPLQLLALDRDFAVAQPFQGENLNAIAANLLVRATADAEIVGRLSYAVKADASLNAEELCTVSDSDRSGLLSAALNSCNIEDLFPNHAWAEHQEESAAAAYHSVAALFVRLGDTQAALECLNLSDKLEESPRSLALKGIIALDRGELLGAVANMVSSLQQYETRKKNDGSHYLSFQPRDLERINAKLLQGLQALNKHDNRQAFDHFADAVFNFDDFYQSYGVDKTRILSH